MAEVAKILSPNKTVVLPDLNAGCSLEESCKAPAFEKFKKSIQVISYYLILIALHGNKSTLRYNCNIIKCREDN